MRTGKTAKIAFPNGFTIRGQGLFNVLLDKAIWLKFDREDRRLLVSCMCCGTNTDASFICACLSYPCPW